MHSSILSGPPCTQPAACDNNCLLKDFMSTEEAVCCKDGYYILRAVRYTKAADGSTLDYDVLWADDMVPPDAGKRTRDAYGTGDFSIKQFIDEIVESESWKRQVGN